MGPRVEHALDMLIETASPPHGGRCFAQRAAETSASAETLWHRLATPGPLEAD